MRRLDRGGTGSVMVSDDMAWQWLYFMHGETTSEDLALPAGSGRPAVWDPSVPEQWERLRERHTAALCAPRVFGSDLDESRPPPGLDEPGFDSLRDLPGLRDWCMPLWPAFLAWNRGRENARSHGHQAAPRRTRRDLMTRALQPRLPADRAVRIIEVGLRPQRVLHRCRAETPTGTVVGLVVTTALLDDEEFFTGACRRELFD
ncbi:hypothetical protein KDL01_10460 [Actinospica durhamensis]|uniref:Uncharacterized protein n=1 Tax=Actinospica durhamensis TaxID=1508375 RepID=A0A941ENL6_9ACTN|nr:hypothetical protein [Actinospica durhamensis]MBR7833688.1 hypothetical protein [Actinospica durhamensis]